jgi:myo-inositol-1(or 4)-monophosphatase
MPSPDLDELRRLAIDIARDAATYVADARQIGREVIQAGSATKSTSTDMVTAVDKASEERIVHAIRAARPGDGIIGEEGTGDAGTTGVQWVIDPIDGTTNFVYGYPATAVSVGVVDQATGDSIAGAVVDIGRRQVFSATKGGGAFCDDEPMTLAEGPVDIAHTLVGTGFSYRPEIRAEQGALVARLLPIIRDIRRGGSAALDLCWTAAGRLDAYFEAGTMWWDRAAGLLIGHEVGLRGAVIEGNGTTPDFVWLAHPRIADELYDLVKPA